MGDFLEINVKQRRVKSSRKETLDVHSECRFDELLNDFCALFLCFIYTIDSKDFHFQTSVRCDNLVESSFKETIDDYLSLNPLLKKPLMIT